MRIGIYHERAVRHHCGGIAQFARETARALAADHEVTLFSRAGPVDPDLAASAVDVDLVPPLPHHETLDRALQVATPLSSQPRSKLLTVAAGLGDGLVGRIDRELDVLLTHQYLDDLLLSNTVQTPVAYTYHGIQSAGLGAAVRERLTGADLHLANSAATATAACETFGRTPDGIVYPGVDPARFTPEATPAFDSGAQSVLFVGRVARTKGVFELVEAVGSLPDVRLVVVGEGALDRVERAARRNGIAERVTCCGAVPHSELPGYYAAADVVCSPSHAEGFGLVNLEAMATGAALVTTPVGGVTEYATHRQNCLLVPPGDTRALASTLDRLLSSPALRADLGASAHRRATDFTWSSQAEVLADHCRRLAAGSAHQPTGERSPRGGDP
jgi:glycosyltransferase involved in cell wall biosynthesis